MIRLTLLLVASIALSGCASTISATRDQPIRDNQGTRTLGSTMDDSLIETKVAVNIAKAHPDLDEKSNIVVVSFNGVVLLAGQTPRAELKDLAGKAAGSVQKVKTVHNELQVGAPSSLLARSNDALLTASIKTRLLTYTDIPGSRIKVVTENGVVFLMGLVTRQEAQRTGNAVARVNGVQKIVKVFEYID
jgi:osmotically-inducible protein OsmY